jgi:hypothetical protein
VLLKGMGKCHTRKSFLCFRRGASTKFVVMPCTAPFLATVLMAGQGLLANLKVTIEITTTRIALLRATMEANAAKVPKTCRPLWGWVQNYLTWQTKLRVVKTLNIAYAVMALQVSSANMNMKSAEMGSIFVSMVRNASLQGTNYTRYGHVNARRRFGKIISMLASSVSIITRLRVRQMTLKIKSTWATRVWHSVSTMASVSRYLTTGKGEFLIPHRTRVSFNRVQVYELTRMLHAVAVLVADAQRDILVHIASFSIRSFIRMDLRSRRTARDLQRSYSFFLCSQLWLEF